MNNIVKMHNDNPNSIINNGGVHYTPLANEMIAKHIQHKLNTSF